MTTERFDAVIADRDSRVFIVLPFDPNNCWGAKATHHVTGTINGYQVRGKLEVDGEHYLLSIGPAWRRGCGLGAGDSVAVTLGPEGPQVADLAPDVAAALATEPEAGVFFEALATFYRKNYVRWIEGAKRPETRAARIAEFIALLVAGEKQR